MGNRSLAAKAERAVRQQREAAHAEFTKPVYTTPRQVVPAYDIAMVRVMPPGRYVTPEGKGKRRAATRCYGDGSRRGAILLRDLVS